MDSSHHAVDLAGEVELLGTLARLGVTVWSNQGVLQIDIPREVACPSIRSHIEPLRSDPRARLRRRLHTG
ncbi:MAG: hypothetical protein WDO56_11935 [Gammaproteobacteria bacterium]